MTSLVYSLWQFNNNSVIHENKANTWPFTMYQYSPIYIVTQVVGGGGRRVAFKLLPRSLCLGKNSEEREGKVGGRERACSQTFEAAISPSCNYPADHLSVRSLSVNQFCTWVTPGKINRKWAVFCSVWKQSEMEHEPHCRFCKKSSISGKRINKPFVLLVRFVI